MFKRIPEKWVVGDENDGLEHDSVVPSIVAAIVAAVLITLAFTL